MSDFREAQALYQLVVQVQKSFGFDPALVLTALDLGNAGFLARSKASQGQCKNMARAKRIYQETFLNHEDSLFLSEIMPMGSVANDVRDAIGLDVIKCFSNSSFYDEWNFNR